MQQTRNFNLKDISIRIIAVLILGVIIWKLIATLSDVLIGQTYDALHHFIIALITAVLTLTLIKIALRMDHISWRQLGQSSLKRNVVSFLLGLILWLVPASIGLWICLKVGWVEIQFQTNLNHLLLSISVLFITVFLIEALSEEFIFRGYVYRFLNVLCPHWVTIILQALLFSLFAYFIGALYSVEQLQFIPGFAIILGLFRAISGNVWTSIGFHVAIMTASQILGPVHGHFDVSGMFMLRFFTFILLPSIAGAIALSYLYPNHNWNNKEPI